MVFVDIFEKAPTTRTILQNTYMDIELTTLALPIRWPRGLWITPTLPNFLKGLMVTRHVDMKIFARGGFAGVIDCFRALQGTFLKVFVSDPFGKYKHIYCWWYIIIFIRMRIYEFGINFPSSDIFCIYKFIQYFKSFKVWNFYLWQPTKIDEVFPDSCHMWSNTDFFHQI